MLSGRIAVGAAAVVALLASTLLAAAQAPPEPDDREIPPNHGRFRLFEKDFRERLRDVTDPTTPLKARLECLSLFALTHDERAVPDLVRMAIDERQPIDFRVSILWTLGEIGDPGGMRALQNALYKIYLKDPAWRHEGITLEGQKEPISLQWLCENSLAHLAEATFEEKKSKNVRSVITLFTELLDKRIGAGVTGAEVKEPTESEEMGRLRAALITLAAVGDRDVRAVRALCNVLRANDKYFPWDFKIIAARSLSSLVERRQKLFAAMKVDDKMSASIADAFLDASIVTDVPEVRAMAGAVIRRTGRADFAAKTLAAILDHPIPKEVRYHAIEAMAFLQSKAAAEALIVQLYDRDKNVRWRAAIALGTTGDPRAVDFLRKLTHDPDPLVRGRVVSALGHLEERAPAGFLAAVPDLIAAMSDPDASVRRQAAQALGRVGTSAAIPPLIRALKDPAPIVRQYAVIALGSTRRASALRPVTGMLNDGEPAVRLAAVDVLGRFDNPAATKALAGALGDADANVRAACARAFRDRLARDAKSTLPLLTEAVVKGEGSARLVALKAIADDFKAAQSQKQGARAAQYLDQLKDADGSLRQGLVAALADKVPECRKVAGDWLADYAWGQKDKPLLERVAALADDPDIKVRIIGLRARNFLRNLP